MTTTKKTTTMKRHSLKPVFGIVTFLGFLCAVGVAGAVSSGEMGLLRGTAIAFTALFVSAVSAAVNEML